MRYPEEESATLEFKEALPKNNQIFKTIVGFCNRKGGKIIIGVKNDRTVIGLSNEALQQALETLDEAIYSASIPHIVPHIYVQRIEDVNILIVEVSAGMNKPYWVKSEGPERGTYIRLGRSILVASPEMVQELQWESRGRSLDSLPVYRAKEEDLDWVEIRRFFGLSENAPLDTTFLLGRRLLVQEHGITYPTTAAILVFGNPPKPIFLNLPLQFVILRALRAEKLLPASIVNTHYYNNSEMPFTLSSLAYPAPSPSKVL